VALRPILSGGLPLSNGNSPYTKSMFHQGCCKHDASHPLALLHMWPGVFLRFGAWKGKGITNLYFKLLYCGLTRHTVGGCSLEVFSLTLLRPAIPLRSFQLDTRRNLVLFTYLEANRFPLGRPANSIEALRNPVRMVVHFAQVRENDGFKPAVVKGFKELEGVCVGQMTVAAFYALLEVPGIWSVEQQIHVMVGFEDQSMASLEPRFDQLSGDPQVRADPQPCVFVLDNKANGLAGIVRYGKWMKEQVPYSKRDPRLKNMHALQLPHLRGEVLQSPPARIYWNMEPAAHHATAAHVILMLVGYHHTANFGGPCRCSVKAAHKLLATQSRIHENTRLGATDQNGISF
jgi:hypothetical protein